MLRPLYGDVSGAARALLAVPPGRRAAACREMVARAEIADAHRVAAHCRHPQFGNGSLMALARKSPLPPEPGFDDPDYCHAFETVLRVLRAYYLSSKRKPRSA